MTIMTLVVAVIVLGTFALPVINNVNTVEVTEEHEGVYGSNPVQSREYTVGYTKGYCQECFDRETMEQYMTFSTTDPGEDANAQPAYQLEKDYLLNMGIFPQTYIFLSTDGTRYTEVDLSESRAEDNAAEYGLTYTVTTLNDLGFPISTGTSEGNHNAYTFTGINDGVKILIPESLLSFYYEGSPQEPSSTEYTTVTDDYAQLSFDSATGVLKAGGNTVAENGDKYGYVSNTTSFDGVECKSIPLTYADGKWYYDGNSVGGISYNSTSDCYVLTYGTTTTTTVYLKGLLLPITDGSDLLMRLFKFDPQEVSCLSTTVQTFFLKDDVITRTTRDSSQFPLPSDITLGPLPELSGRLVSEYDLEYGKDSYTIYVKSASVPSSYDAVFCYLPMTIVIGGTIPLPESIVVSTFTSVKGDLVDGQFVESENGSLLKIPSQILTEGTTYNVGADQTYYFGTSDSASLVENKAPESADVPDADKPTFTVNSANAGVYDMTFGTDVQGDAFIIIAATCIYDYTETHNEELNPLLGVVAVMLCIGLICMAVAAWSGRENL